MNVMKPALMAAAIVVWAALAVFAQSEPPADDLPSVDAAAMLKSASPDLDPRIAQLKPVRIPYNASTLTAPERQMVDQLVIALRALESAYWRQSQPGGLALFKALASKMTPQGRGA